jgi:phosphoribosyl-ATP pyrophosphohydrolase
VYWSRSRNEIWRKGATSGAVQRLLAVDADCDRDALRFTVRQSGEGFCHLSTRSCFGEARGLGELERRVRAIAASPEAGSYTAKLLENPDLLAKKLIEEAGELGQASTREQAAAEGADLLYFAMVKLSAAGVAMEEVERVLDRRALKVTRRSQQAGEKSFDEVREGDPNR